MRIRHCDECGEYSLRDVCKCNSKTRNASYKFKQLKRLEPVIMLVKENVDKKRAEKNKV
jgi:hypothetical protein